MHSNVCRTSGLSDETYSELVRSVFKTIVPTTIMGFLFVVVTVFVVATFPDPWLICTGLLGSALSLLRIGVLVIFDRRSRDLQHDAHAMGRIERAFAACYLSFATLLGVFAFRATQIDNLEVQLLVTTLVVGYAAGVAAGVALRPWISISALALSVLPLAAASILFGNSAHSILALTLMLFLIGGINSLLSRYRLEIDKATMRQTLASLARHDALTGLGNRSSLEASLAHAAGAPGDHLIALHYIDLDRFKPVNDLHGHLIGDQLLREVAARLRSVCVESASAIRLGGDEFVVLQHRIGHHDEAELMARRIVRCLEDNFRVDGREISISASLGCAVASPAEAQLDALLNAADNALYSVKRIGGGSASMAASAAAR